MTSSSSMLGNRVTSSKKKIIIIIIADSANIFLGAKYEESLFYKRYTVYDYTNQDTQHFVVKNE